VDVEAWDRSDDPMAMLDAIHGVASERKLRLFSFGLCRRLRFTPDSVEDGEAFVARAAQLFDSPPRPPGWRLGVAEEEELDDPDTWYRLNHEVSERFDLAWSGFLEADSTPIEWEGDPAFTDEVMDNWAAVTIIGSVSSDDPWVGAREATTVVIELAVRKAVQAGQPVESARAIASPAARTDVCRVLREVFGNPFQPVAVNPDWLTWRDGTVPKLAQGIYDDHRFDLLPILADALEEAGCDNAEILTHCRSAGPHLRGCWVIDCALAKA
jgi:hypothetical protein